MAFGLEIYNDVGQKTLDIQRLGWMLVDKFHVAYGVTFSKTYSDLGAYTLAAHAVSLNYTTGHRVTFSGLTLTVAPVWMPTAVSPRTSASDIFVFAR